MKNKRDKGSGIIALICLVGFIVGISKRDYVIVFAAIPGLLLNTYNYFRLFKDEML